MSLVVGNTYDAEIIESLPVPPGTVERDRIKISPLSVPGSSAEITVTDEVYGAGDGTKTTFTHTLASTPIKPGSVVVTEADGEVETTYVAYEFYLSGRALTISTTAVPVSSAVRGTNTPIVPGSFQIYWALNSVNDSTRTTSGIDIENSDDYNALGTDLGNGVIAGTGSPSTPVNGTINYTTGAYTFTYQGEDIDGGIPPGERVFFVIVLRTTNGAGIRPNNMQKIQLMQTPGIVFRDDGSGALLTSAGSGTIDYSTGQASITFDTAPAGGIPITVDYVQLQVGTPTPVTVSISTDTDYTFTVYVDSRESTTDDLIDLLLAQFQLFENYPIYIFSEASPLGEFGLVGARSALRRPDTLNGMDQAFDVQVRNSQAQTIRPLVTDLRSDIYIATSPGRVDDDGVKQEIPAPELVGRSFIQTTAPPDMFKFTIESIEELGPSPSVGGSISVDNVTETFLVGDSSSVVTVTGLAQNMNAELAQSNYILDEHQWLLGSRESSDRPGNYLLTLYRVIST